MSEWLPIGLASLAILISIVSLVWNWRHSESIVRRSKYPAVAWHQPVISRRERGTAVSVTVCNHGPREIGAVWLGAYLSSRFETKPWCKTEQIKSVPIDEELEITITDTLEEDIKERFSGLYFDGIWHCEGKPHRYKTVFEFGFQPLVACTGPVMTKGYYSLRPIVEDGDINSWEIEPISQVRGLLPAFW